MKIRDDGLVEVCSYITVGQAHEIAAELIQRADEGETAKHRHLVREYCQGNGIDLGSAGVPVVPWAIQLDLPSEEYRAYNPTRGDAAIHWRGSALDLPFKDSTLDFVHASHILEDFEEWDTPLREWHRVLKAGGHLIIAVPDHQRFRERVRKAKEEHGVDLDNLSHRSESLVHVGALSEWFDRNFASQKYEVLYDGFVSDSPDEYSVLWVGRRLF